MLLITLIYFLPAVLAYLIIREGLKNSSYPAKISDILGVFLPLVNLAFVLHFIVVFLTNYLQIYNWDINKIVRRFFLIKNQ